MDFLSFFLNLFNIPLLNQFTLFILWILWQGNGWQGNGWQGNGWQGNGWQGNSWQYPWHQSIPKLDWMWELSTILALIILGIGSYYCRQLQGRLRITQDAFHRQEENLGQLHAQHAQELEYLSQRFQAELATHEQAVLERLDSVLSSLEEVVWSYAPETQQFLYINPAVEGIYGYKAEAFFKHPDLWFQGIHADDRDRVKHTFEAALTTGIPQNLDYRILRCQGEIRWLHSRIYPIQDATGKVIRIDGLAIDISDRKQSEAWLSLMERAIAAANNGIIITDASQPNNPAIYVNPAVTKMTGYSAAEILGKNCRFLQNNDTQQPELARLRVAIHNKEECNIVVRNYRKDGSLFWNELYVAPVHNNQGEVTHFIGIQNDITEQKRAETELQESESSLRTIVNTISDGLLIIDRDGKILFANPSSELIFGKPAATLKGQEFGLPWIRNKRVEISILNPHRRLIPVEVTVENMILQDQLVYLVSLRDVTERREAEQALRAKEAQFRLMFECAPTGMAISSPAGQFVHVNPALCETLGYSEEELLQLHFQDVVDPLDQERCLKVYQELLYGQIDEARIEKRYRKKQGDLVYTILQTSLLRDEEGNPAQFISQVVDISDRKRAEAALRESEEFLRSIYDGIEASIVIVDVLQKDGSGYEFCYVGSNPAYEKITGLSADLIRAKTPQDLWQPHMATLIEQRYRHCVEANQCVTYEEHVPLQGRELWWITHLTPIRNEAGEISRIIGTSFDISQRKEAEERMRYMALYDPLTDLPNRILFLDRLKHAMERSQRRNGYLFAVLFIDLDRFKVVNDSLGHAIGDQLLTAFARRIETYLRPCDTLARLGGDEFTILLEELTDTTTATKIAHRINLALAKPFNLDGYEVFSNASIGIALGTPNHQLPEDLVREADTAMYRAKANGKACYAVFDSEMHKRALIRLQLETDLRRAIDRQELQVYYQPIVCLKTGHLVGFEALIRWPHPEQGFIPPDRFIPLAEETGLILEIGQFVLKQACQQTHQWHQQYPFPIPLKISVNLSSRQLSDPYLLDKILHILKMTDLESRYLRLEITESLLMENPESAASTLEQLNTQQIQLALDDFGTGYSSLSYLRRFPVQTIKIDRSFVQRLGTQEEDLEIVRTIVTLAHNLGRTVVAEGIETASQLAQLQKLGCELGQGFWFARALTPEAAEQLLSQQLLNQQLLNQQLLIPHHQR